MKEIFTGAIKNVARNRKISTKVVTIPIDER